MSLKTYVFLFFVFMSKNFPSKKPHNALTG